MAKETKPAGMKVLVPARDLKRIVASAAARTGRSTLPILQDVLVTADACGLTATGFDLETGWRGGCDAQVQTPGAACVSGVALAALTASLPDTAVQLEVSEHALQVVCGRSNYKLSGLPAEEYPTLPEVAGDAFTVKAGPLLVHLRRAAIAVSKDEAKTYMTSVLLETGDAGLTVAATDGYQLSASVMPMEEAPAVSVIFRPGAVISYLSDLDADADVTVTHDRGRIQLASGGTRFTTRLVEGTFPNYRRVIPEAAAMQVTVRRAAWLEALKRMAFLTRGTSLRVIHAFDGDTLRLSVRNGGAGEGLEEVEVIGGGSLESAYNIAFLTSFLSMCEADGVVLGLNSALSPMTIRPVDDSTWLYLAMPMQIV